MTVFRFGSVCLAATKPVRQLAMVYIPGNPGFNGVAFSKGFLIMSHGGADTVDVFNSSKRRLITQIKLAKPCGVVVDKKSARAYVASAADNSIAVISTDNWKVESTIPLKLQPGPLALSADGHRLYVGNSRDQSVSAVELRNNNQVATARINGHPEALVFDPTRNVLYASLEDTAEVAVIDPGLKVMLRYSLLASQPVAMALDPEARRLYVAVRSAVVALDADSGAELGRVPAPPGVDSVWLNKADGNLYAASSNEFNVIRIAGNNFTLAGDLPLRSRGYGIAYDPQRKLIFIPGGSEGRSLVLILKPVNAAPGTPAQPAEASIR